MKNLNEKMQSRLNILPFFFHGDRKKIEYQLSSFRLCPSPLLDLGLLLIEYVSAPAQRNEKEKRNVQEDQDQLLLSDFVPAFNQDCLNLRNINRNLTKESPLGRSCLAFHDPRKRRSEPLWCKCVPLFALAMHGTSLKVLNSL